MRQPSVFESITGRWNSDCIRLYTRSINCYPLIEQECRMKSLCKQVYWPTDERGKTFADHVWAMLINHNRINVRKKMGQTDRRQTIALCLPLWM